MSILRTNPLACAALLAVALTAARGAVTISNVNVTNVGATTFTVVWQTSEESTPGLDVFSDPAGATAITADVALEYYPLGVGDPAVVNNPAARATRRALELLASQRCVVSVRVSGLSPATTYYVRPRTFDSMGADNAAAPTPLTVAPTAAFTEMIKDAMLLRVRVPTFAAKGMVLLVQGPAGTTPLSAIVGDTAPDDTALLSTAFLIDTVTGTNAALTGTQTFQIRAIGAGAPDTTFAETIDFTGEFHAATHHLLEANIVSPAPLITQHPQSLAVSAGSAATFTVAANGTPVPAFKWQRKPAAESSWADLANDSIYSGTATTSLTVANTTLAMSGDQFRVIVTNGIPPDATSDAATLTVTPSAVAPAITSPPKSTSVVAGLDATFTIAATGTPVPTYQWQRKAPGSSSWDNLSDGAGYSGTLSPTLTIAGTNLAMSGSQFRVVIGNGVPPDTTSDPVTLTVATAVSAPTITTQPASKSVVIGADATFTVAAAGTPTPAYQWQIRLAGSTAWLNVTPTENYAGVATETLTVHGVTAAMSGDAFRAVASNGVPPDATSDIATLTSAAAPLVSHHPDPMTAPAGGNTNFTVAATGTGQLSYAWQRRAAGNLEWQPLVESALFVDTATATLRLVGVQLGMNGDQFRCVITDSIGSTASDAAALLVTKAGAVVTLTKLRQWYDGTPRSIDATTTPTGLNVVFGYNGGLDAPTVPGTYPVTGLIEDPLYAGASVGELVVTATVTSRHAPNVAGLVDGSVHVLNAENISVTGSISGDLLVLGTPDVVVNGTLAGTKDGPGAGLPTGYTVTFGASAVTKYLVRHVDAVTIPAVLPPPVPTGTRNVSLSMAGQTAGDFSTVKNLSVGGAVGLVTVPPGTYGSLIANGSAGFVFGIAGATEPAVYNLQSLLINPLLGTARLVVVGPVIINVASTAAIYGEAGAVLHPEWLHVNMAAGSLSTNSRATFYGYVVAPNSAVTLNGSSTIKGGIMADRVNVTTGAAVRQVSP